MSIGVQSFLTPYSMQECQDPGFSLEDRYSWGNFVLSSHSLCSHWQSSLMVHGGRQAARAGIFVFQCLPLWELKASLVPGSVIILGSSSLLLLWALKTFITLTYQLNYYFYIISSYKIINSEDLIHVCLLCKSSQKGSKLHCYCQVPGGKRHSAQPSLRYSCNPYIAGKWIGLIHVKQFWQGKPCSAERYVLAFWIWFQLSR